MEAKRAGVPVAKDDAERLLPRRDHGSARACRKRLRNRFLAVPRRLVDAIADGTPLLARVALLLDARLQADRVDSPLGVLVEDRAAVVELALARAVVPTRVHE